MSRLQTSVLTELFSIRTGEGDDGKWRTVNNERHGLDWISAVAAWFGHEIRISRCTGRDYRVSFWRLKALLLDAPRIP